MSDPGVEKARRFKQLVYTDLPAALKAAAGDRSLLEVKDALGETAFHDVVIESRLDLAEALIKAGADINTCDTEGMTPLMSAARLNDVEMVRWLLDHGADAERKNGEGATALSKTVEYGAREAFDILIALPREHGIDHYFDDLTAEQMFFYTDHPLRATLLALGLSKRF